MAKWTVGEGDAVMVIEVTDDGHISVDIPSRQPIIADPGTAEDMRSRLGAAIGIALGDTTPTP